MKPDAAAFSELIQAELEGFQEFHRVLQRNRPRSIEGDVDQLLQLAPHKSELMEKLSGFSAERNRWLTATGLENNASGIAALMDAIQADAETRESWRELLDMAREAEQINRTNGTLIDTRLRHNQQALSVLKTAANPGTSLYGPDGQISAASSGRQFDKA